METLRAILRKNRSWGSAQPDLQLFRARETSAGPSVKTMKMRFWKHGGKPLWSQRRAAQRQAANVLRGGRY